MNTQSTPVQDSISRTLAKATRPHGPIAKAALALIALMVLMSAAAATLALLSLAKTAQAQTTGLRQSTGLRVLQSILDPTTPRMQVRSELVPIHFGASITSVQGQQQQATATSFQIQIPYANYGYAMSTQAEILSQAKTLMSVTVGQQVGQKIKRAMAESKANSGVFLFDQELLPKGSPRDMRLVWSVTVTDDGKVLIPDPKIVDPDPTLIHMTYTSSDATAELPASWRHVDAGILTWQLKKPDGTELTTRVRISTGGAFNDVAADPERMVNCLAKRASHSSCPQSYPDATTLMGDTASASAIIDYVRKLEPAYEEQTLAGQATYRPRFSVSVDEREFDRASCTYRNKGRVGALLNTTVDRYAFVADAPKATFVNRFTRQDVSPEHQYDLTRAVNDAAVSLASLIIDPINTGNPIIEVATMPEVLYIAPISTPSTTIWNQPPRLRFTDWNNTTYTGRIEQVTTSTDGRFRAAIGYQTKSNPFGGSGRIEIDVFQACRNQFESLTLTQANYRNWARIGIDFSNQALHQNADFYSSFYTQVQIFFYQNWPQNPAVIATTNTPYACPYGTHDPSRNLCSWNSIALNSGWIWASGGRQTDAPIPLNVDIRPHLRVGWNTISLSHGFHPSNPTPAGFVIQGQFKNYQ